MYFLTDNVIYANTKMKATSSNGTSYTSNTTLVYENVSYDTASAYNSGTGIYTIPADGYYKCTSSIRFTTASTSFTAMGLRKNGTGFASRLQDDVGVGSAQSVEVSGTEYFNKGDEVDVIAVFAGGTKNKNTDPSYNFFTVERVSDYSAGQPVAFGAATPTQYGLTKASTYLEARGNGTGFTTGASAQPVSYTVSDQNGITADGGGFGTTFTVEQSGMYMIDASVMWSAGSADNTDQLITSITVNAGVVFRTIDYSKSPAQSFMHTYVSKLTRLEAGDTIQITAANGTAAYSVYTGGGTAGYRQLSIYKVAD